MHVYGATRAGCTALPRDEWPLDDGICVTKGAWEPMRSGAVHTRCCQKPLIAVLLQSQSGVIGGALPLGVPGWRSDVHRHVRCRA